MISINQSINLLDSEWSHIIWIIINLEKNFNISPTDCCNAQRLCSYFIYIPWTNTIAERLRRSPTGVVITGDGRFES